MLSCSLLLLAVACGSEDKQDTETTADSTVIETGIPHHNDSVDSTDSSTTEELPDKGEDATIADLTAAQSQIESCYFEQTVEYPDGAVFIQVWYKDGRMKLVSSVNSYVLNECYYDYNQRTLVTYYLDSASALQSDFDPESADAPDNPVLENYADYTLAGGEYIGDQYCLKLETPEGDYLWISTKLGLPLKAEYTDSLGERMTTQYGNIKLNSVQDGDLALPEGIEIRVEGAAAD